MRVGLPGSPLLLIVVGLLAGPVNGGYYLWFLTTKYGNVFTLDGEWLIRRQYLIEYLTDTFGGILLALWLGLLVAGLIGLHMVRPRPSRDVNPREG